MKKLLAMLLATSLLSACATQTVHLQKGNSRLSYEESQTFFISGLGQEQTVNAVQICGDESRIAKVESHLSGTNILLGIVTLGIYTPRTARVYCK